MIGQNLSQIVQELGTGGMVVVYLAHDSRLEPLVALKFRSRGRRPEYRAAGVAAWESLGPTTSILPTSSTRPAPGSRRSGSAAEGAKGGDISVQAPLSLQSVPQGLSITKRQEPSS